MGTAATTSSASSGSYLRRQSLFGTDDRIILEIGSRVSKIGFSGEVRPREIFYTLDGIYENGENILEHTEGLLWTPDMFRCKSDEERRLKAVKLKARLTVNLRDIFYKRLMVDPKQRKIFIIENILMPDVVKQAISEILFGNLLVPSICYVPLHLVCTLAIGRLTAIVLDVGYQEASLLPVYSGRTLMPTHLISSTRASKRMAKRLRALLSKYAKYIPLLSDADSGKVKARMVPEVVLSWRFLDEIISKALLVAIDAPMKENHSLVSSHQAEKFDDVQALERRYNLPSVRAKDMAMHIPPASAGSTTPPAQPSTLGTSTDSVTTNVGRGSIIIPGWIRERTAEVLFEEGDEDDPSLVQMVLQTLIKLPVDLRIPMASSIYLTGGTAMLPGLAHRLRLELVQRLEACAGDGQMQSIALTTARVGKLRLLPTKQKIIHDQAEPVEEDERELQREQHRYGPISKLADVIALLNDQSPRLSSNGSLQGGNAPSFSVNISGWIGGSLMGSLRVETTSQKTREEWDLEQEEMSAKAKASKDDTITRPGLGLGRGSFLGTVNGLDLGTYGPLSAGARGTFTSPKSAASPRSSKVA